MRFSVLTDEDSDQDHITTFQLNYLINKQKKEKYKKFIKCFLMVSALFVCVTITVTLCQLQFKRDLDAEGRRIVLPGVQLKIKQGKNFIAKNKTEENDQIDENVSVKNQTTEDFDDASDAVLVLVGGLTQTTAMCNMSHRHTEIVPRTDFEVIGKLGKQCQNIPTSWPPFQSYNESLADYLTVFLFNKSFMLCLDLEGFCYESFPGEVWKKHKYIDRSSVSSSITATVNSVGFMLGGRAIDLSPNFDHFQFRNGDFSKSSNFQLGLAKSCAVSLEDQSMLIIIGGETRKGKIFEYMIMYDIVNINKTSVLKRRKVHGRMHKMKTGRSLHGCARATIGTKDVIVVAGGETGQTRALDSVEYFDLNNQEAGWISLPPLNFGRTNKPSLGFIDGRLLVAGGAGNSGTDSKQGREGNLVSLNTMETYDEELNSWKIMNKKLDHAREGHTTFKVTRSFCK
eukprot:GFUD01001313.1.p1 GENE.GFUD01001313.1~~GFUD01001313.1.p1  ORF type:complete len:455 (-),score=97.00 GFUD01001313.1:138-1502(-)